MITATTRSAAGANRQKISVRIALGILFVLAALDILLPRVAVASLYAIPLMLLARAGYLRPLWRSTLVFVVLIYGIYFVKCALWHPGEGFDYRLVNRTFIAVMIWLLTISLEIWRESNAFRQEALQEGAYEPLDAEVDSTMAILISVPLALLIALIDVFLPGQLNVAVLFPIPQLVCAYAGSQRLLWAATIVLVLLTYLGYALGPPIQGAPEVFVLINRLLVGVLLVSIAMLLHFWIKLPNRGSGIARRVAFARHRRISDGS